MFISEPVGMIWESQGRKADGSLHKAQSRFYSSWQLSTMQKRAYSPTLAGREIEVEKAIPHGLR